MSKSSAASMPQSRLDGILSQKNWHIDALFDRLRSTGRQGCASLIDTRCLSRLGRARLYRWPRRQAVRMICLPALFHVADNGLGTPDQFRSDLYSPARVNRLGLVTERLHLLV